MVCFGRRHWRRRSDWGGEGMVGNHPAAAAFFLGYQWVIGWCQHILKVT
jgi:hypothetical protein